MRRLNDELSKGWSGKQFAAKSNRPRILVTGSPIMYPNLKIRADRGNGRVLAADETCMGSGRSMTRDRHRPEFDGRCGRWQDATPAHLHLPHLTDNRQRIFVSSR